MIIRRSAVGRGRGRGRGRGYSSFDVKDSSFGFIGVEDEASVEAEANVQF